MSDVDHPGAERRLCVQHAHLHGRRPFRGADHDRCAVCRQESHSNEDPPPPSNHDYDAPAREGSVMAEHSCNDVTPTSTATCPGCAGERGDTAPDDVAEAGEDLDAGRAPRGGSGPVSGYGFAEVWVHAGDGAECGDPEITSGPDGVARCYAHEEVCRPGADHRTEIDDDTTDDDTEA